MKFAPTDLHRIWDLSTLAFGLVIHTFSSQISDIRGRNALDMSENPAVTE